MKKQANIKKRSIAIALVTLTLVVGAISFAAAKYVSNHKKEAEIHASNFHFSSDYLEYGTQPEWTVSDWASNQVQFRLYNYQKENIAQISETDILYQIKLSGNGWTATVTDEAGNAVAADNGVYKMPANAERTYHQVTLTYSGSAVPEKVAVDVETTSPYKMNLEAVFVLATADGIEFTVEDQGNYNVITIKTNQYSGNVVVEWSDTHSPDNTCAEMMTWRDADRKGIFTAKPYTVYTLIFVETQAGQYREADFSIEEGA